MGLTPSIDGAEVRTVLRSGREIALIDLRPEATFAAGHPLFAASMPLDTLELEAPARLPRLHVPIVVYGEREVDTLTGVARLAELGYTAISILSGGLAGWVASGGELFQDVNTPGKAFGELVAAQAGTPQIDPRRAQPVLGSGPVLIDVRTPGEYTTMHVPGAVNVPGAGVVGAAAALAPDPEAMVIVNCAGRTRGIIAAQSLIDAGLPNPVAALQNGTIGWTLAGLSLERGPDSAEPTLPAAAAAQAQARATAVSARAGVPRIDARGLGRLRERGDRTVYCFDVRSAEEFGAGHPPGFTWAPGGQLVQETDHYAPVRGAVIVLAEDDSGRAHMTASWLAQMGWDSRVLVGPPGPASSNIAAPDIPTVEWLSADAVATATLVVDVSTSVAYDRSHIRGSVWCRRSVLAGLQGSPPDEALAGAELVVVTSDDDRLTALACRDLARHLESSDHRAPVAGFAGGPAAWAADGRAVDTGPGRKLSAPDDVYRRPYVGTDVSPDAMRAYLEWEHGLVAQLERDGTHGFWVLGRR